MTIVKSYSVDYDGYSGLTGGRVFRDFESAKKYYDSLSVAYKIMQCIFENRTLHTITYKTIASEG